MGRLKTIGPRLAILKATPVRVLQTKAGASEWVRGSAWMAKKAEIQELHRFTCAACGTVRADHDVDHIVPLEQGGAPMANSNLQLLCSGPDRCHAKKTAREAANHAHRGHGARRAALDPAAGRPGRDRPARGLRGTDARRAAGVHCCAMTHGAAPTAAAGDWKANRNRHAARQLDMRQRRDRRELAAQLQERYERQALPAPDEGPPPRID